jgi:hypothetical protein
MNTTLTGSKVTIRLAYNHETRDRDLVDDIAGMSGVVVRVLADDYLAVRLADGDEHQICIRRCQFAAIA